MIVSQAKMLEYLLQARLHMLARRSGFDTFFNKLKATIAQYVSSEDAAEDWTRSTHVYVLGYMHTLFSLKVRANGLFVIRRPKTSASEALDRLKNPKDHMFERAWIEMPADAIHALEIASAHLTKRRLNQFRIQSERGFVMPRAINAIRIEERRFGYSFPDRLMILHMTIPDCREVAPLVDAAQKIVREVLNTTEKSARDDMLGSMLRMWQGRYFAGEPRAVPERPEHDRAWRFIKAIEDCYRDLFSFIDGDHTKCNSVFDIPLRRATREDLYNQRVLWQPWPKPNRDVQAMLQGALAN